MVGAATERAHRADTSHIEDLMVAYWVGNFVGERTMREKSRGEVRCAEARAEKEIKETMRDNAE